jgi:hypothetical protein
MPMQTAPRAVLKVIKPKLLLERLVRLLAHPTCLDERGQPLQGGTGCQVGQVVLAFPRGAMLAYQPDFVAGQMLTGSTLQTHRRPIGNPHAHGSEPRPQRTLGAYRQVIRCHDAFASMASAAIAS